MYSVILKPRAAKYIKSQTRRIQRQLIKHIEALADNPKPAGAKLLHSRENLYRIRSGDYRIIYQIQHDELNVVVAKIGHRKDIYESFDR